MVDDADERLHPQQQQQEEESAKNRNREQSRESETGYKTGTKQTWNKTSLNLNWNFWCQATQSIFTFTAYTVSSELHILNLCLFTTLNLCFSPMQSCTINRNDISRLEWGQEPYPKSQKLIILIKTKTALLQSTVAMQRRSGQQILFSSCGKDSNKCPIIIIQDYFQGKWQLLLQKHVINHLLYLSYSTAFVARTTNRDQ